jgi:hypothetical protein
MQNCKQIMFKSDTAVAASFFDYGWIISRLDRAWGFSVTMIELSRLLTKSGSQTDTWIQGQIWATSSHGSKF